MSPRPTSRRLSFDAREVLIPKGDLARFRIEPSHLVGLEADGATHCHEAFTHVADLEDEVRRHAVEVEERAVAHVLECIDKHHAKDLHGAFVDPQNQVVAGSVVGDLEIVAIEDAMPGNVLAGAIENCLCHASHSFLLHQAFAQFVHSRAVPVAGGGVERDARVVLHRAIQPGAERVFLSWGLVGAVGVYAQDRSALIGGREAKAANYKDAAQELEEIDGKRRAMTQRTVAQVDAAIAAVLARPVMSGERVRGTVGKLSANCTKEERATAETCVEVAGLREERAAAEEATRLQLRQRKLRLHVSTLREGGGSLPADPVAELLAWLSRGQLSVRDIAFGFPLVFAFLIEIVSAFGLAGLVAYAEATKPTDDVSSMTQLDMARSGALARADAGLSEHGRVVKWMADRTEPTGDTTAITIEELHADYEVWCVGKSLKAAALHDFTDNFDRVRDVPELVGKIRKFGTRYYGIRLVGSNVARLASPKRRT